MSNAKLKKKKKNHEKMNTPMAAMIDVTFLLLIFFIVTQNDIKEESFLQVNVATPGPPKANTSPSIDIHVLAESYVFLGKHYPNVKQLREIIGLYAVHGKNTSVNLKLADEATQRRLIDLSDVLSEQGMEKINIFFLKDQVN